MPQRKHRRELNLAGIASLIIALATVLSSTVFETTISAKIGESEISASLVYTHGLEIYPYMPVNGLEYLSRDGRLISPHLSAV